MGFKVAIVNDMTDCTAIDFMSYANDFLDGNSAVVGASDLQVTQNSPTGLSVLVSSGTIYAYISSLSSYLRAELSDASTALTIDPNTSGSTRIDLICAEVDPTATPDADGNNVASLQVVKGTPGSGVPVTPANHTCLAQVTVVDSASAITNSDIADKRNILKMNNGIVDYSSMTTPVSFGVYLSTNQSLANNTATKITLDTEEFNNGNGWDNTNHKFVIPSTGVYFIQANIEINGVGNTSRDYIALYKNGSEFKRGTDSAGDGFDTGFNLSCVVSLTAGDYLELYASQNSGSSHNVDGGESLTYMSGFRIR